MSGKDLGIRNNLIFSDVGQVYFTLVDLCNLAMEYSNNDIAQSNKLVLQYIRKGSYGDTSPFLYDSDYDEATYIDYFKWKVVAGSIDDDFCYMVDYNLKGLTLSFKDNITGKNHDLPHFAATLNAILNPVLFGIFEGFDELVDIYAGWAGDAISFAQDIKKIDINGDDYQKWAQENIAKNDETHFNLTDYIDDIDAVNIGYLLKDPEVSLPTAFFNYYILHSKDEKTDSEQRSTKFLDNVGTSMLNQYCAQLLVDDFPMNVCNKMLAKDATEEKYIRAAIDAFVHKVVLETYLGR